MLLIDPTMKKINENRVNAKKMKESTATCFYASLFLSHAYWVLPINYVFP